MISFRVNNRQFERETKKLAAKVRRFSRDGVPVASQRALNKTAAKARTETRRDLATTKGVPQRVLNPVMKVFKASKKKLVSRVWVGLKRGIQFEDIKKATAKKRLSKPFRARFKSGKVSEDARRILPSLRAGQGRSGKAKNLPIDYKIRLNPEAKAILKEKANHIGRTVYKSEYTRQLKLKLQKLSAT